MTLFLKNGVFIRSIFLLRLETLSASLRVLLLRSAETPSAMFVFPRTEAERRPQVGGLAAVSRVGEMRAVRNVRSDRCAPAEPSVAPPAAAWPSGRRPPQRLGAVPEGHQTGAPDAQAPAAVASL